MARNYCSTTSISEGLNDAISVEQLFELERLEESAYLAGFDAGQAQPLEQASEGFEEWFKDSWNCDFDRHITWHFNQLQAWQASALHSAKMLAEKDKEIERLKEKIEELDYCQKAFYEATKKVGW